MPTASFKNNVVAQAASSSMVVFTFWDSKFASVPTNEKMPAQVCPLMRTTFTGLPTTTPPEAVSTSWSTNTNVSTPEN